MDPDPDPNIEPDPDRHQIETQMRIGIKTLPIHNIG
jgi:hypothetical protein